MIELKKTQSGVKVNEREIPVMDFYDVVVIGGGVSKAGQCVIDAAMPSFTKYAFPGARDCKMLLATLGNDAGIIGGAALCIGK